VGDEGKRGRGELALEPAQKPSGALLPRPAPEEHDPAVRGQGSGDGAVGKHDELVEARGERAQLANRGTERRMLGVDDLGCEHEPAARRTPAEPVHAAALASSCSSSP
jgi:hypothetical protein